MESLKLGIEQNPWVKTIELGEPHTRLCFWHSFWETNNEGKSGATDTLYLFSFCHVLQTIKGKSDLVFLLNTIIITSSLAKGDVKEKRSVSSPLASEDEQPNALKEYDKM